MELMWRGGGFQDGLGVVMALNGQYSVQYRTSGDPCELDSKRGPLGSQEKRKTGREIVGTGLMKNEDEYFRV